MKPQDRRFWTATQVKVLSPDIINIKEADGFHMPEGSKSRFDMREHVLSFGVEVRGTESSELRSELGRSCCFLEIDICKQSEKERMQRRAAGSRTDS